MTPLVGRAPAATAAAAALDRIEADGRAAIWIEVFGLDETLAAADAVDRRVAAGEHLPLAGTTVAVKGNIDVAGHRTTAACPSFGDVATKSAPVVTALEEAGAVVVGITNLDQFATGLVGTRSPYGACPNAHWPELVSGGSSSGSAAAVAAGLVELGLGTDTAGSGRVPAAANGIVGLKPTRGWCSTAGIVPACPSIDCVSFFARSVELAGRAARISASTPIEPPSSPEDDDPWRRVGRMNGRVPGGLTRLGVPDVGRLDFDGDEQGAERFSAAVDELATALVGAARGVTIVEVDVAPFIAAGRLLYEGGFVAERYTAIGEFLAAVEPDDLDPIVRDVITDAGRVQGWEVFRDIDALQRLRRITERTWDDADVLVVPSVPRVPAVAEVAAQPLTTNAMLGTYTNFVNLLDLCALSVPVGAAAGNGPPASITLVAPAWSDDLLLRTASRLSAPDGS